MSKEFMETLNLKTSIKISGEKIDFELYTIDKGFVKAIKFNNDVFVLNNGFKQNNETSVTEVEDNDLEPKPVIEKENVDDLIVEMINGSSNNQTIKPMVEPLVKSTDKVKKSFNTIFDAEDIIASPGEYITCALYKPVLDKILNNISPVFTGRDVSKIILDIYKKIGRNISSGSAYVYSGAYRRYMLDHGLIVVKDEVKKIYEVVDSDKGKTVEQIVEEELSFPVKKKLNTNYQNQS